MAKGVLGNDPFRRGAATRKAEDATPEAKPPVAAKAGGPKKKRKRSVDEALASTPAGTELKEPPRKKKAAGNRAGKRVEVEEPIAPAELTDDSQDVTRAIQEATPRLGQESEVADEDEGDSLPERPSQRQRRPALRGLATGSQQSSRAEHADADEPVATARSGRTDAAPPDEDAPSLGGAPEPSSEEDPEEADDDSDWNDATEEGPSAAPIATAAQDEAASLAEEVLPIAAAQRHTSGTTPLEAVTSALSLAREVAAQTFRSDAVSRMSKVADGVFSALMTGIGASGSAEVDPYGKDANLTRKLTPISDFFYERYWRVTVEGAPHVPAGPSILVANHSGAIPIDGFILHQALQRERPDLIEARWLAEDQIFHAPFLGTLYNRLGAIRASPENAVRLLDEGRPVITFPEGVHGIRKPFQERYQLKRLGRGGFAKLAIRQRVSIVPVAIVGAEESMPLLAKLPGGFLGLPYLPITVPPLPARWMIRFGEPLKVDHIDASAADDLLEVQRLVERTRESIEGMLKALIKERGNVF